METFDIDVLPLGSRSDFLWSVGPYHPDCYKFSVSRTPEQIKSDVFESRRVQYIIEKISKDKKKSVTEVTEEAKAIIDEMAHNMSLSTLRFMAFLMRKILCSLYRKVMVNGAGIERLRQAVKDSPVVLVPTHRSYMDFLLVSFVCFALNLPLPFIAAAQDFMGVRVVRRLFRRSGAFFMRRSFMSDELYWVIFQEYVQNQLQKGDKPLEFFLEGTRSRTGKFLHPRLGLLSMVVDLYVAAGVPNVQFCPISISYERVLEEPLFSYELLGIPKPKESLRGLIKSRGVLSEDYGSIYVYFGEIMKVSQFVEGYMEREATACIPRHLPRYLTSDEKEVVRELGYKINISLQKGTIIMPNSLVAAIMLQHHHKLQFSELVQQTVRMKDLLRYLGANVVWPDDKSGEAVTRECLVFLKSSLDINENDVIQVRNPDPDDVSAEEKKYKPSHPAPLQTMSKQVLDKAAIHIHLVYKRNKLLYYFYGMGMLSVALRNKSREGRTTVAILSDDCAFLRKLFSKEVASILDSSEEVLQKTLRLLELRGIINLTGDRVTVKNHSDIELAFNIWCPILTAYWVMWQYLLTYSGSGEEQSVYKVVRAAQRVGVNQILAGVTDFYEVLNLDLLKNALETSVDLGAVKARKSPKGIMISLPDRIKLRNLCQRLREYLTMSEDDYGVSTPLSKL